MTQNGPAPWANFLYPAFVAAGQRTGVDPALLFAVAMTEDRALKPNIVNTFADPRTGKPVNHDGLMQLSAENEKTYGVTDPFDPGQNVMAGASLLRDNLKMYDGDLSKALQQYNGGNPHRWGAATQAYVDNVLKNYKSLTGAQAPDVLPQFKPVPLPPPMLRPDPGSSTPVHLNMNADPSVPANLAQGQPDAQSPAQVPLGVSAGNQASAQPTAALALHGPGLMSLQLTKPGPSPFVQAFLTNAIFGHGNPAYPFALGTGIRPGGPSGR